jgi:serine phosphatase RsbU (regulator of sigma subunit)
VSVKFKLILGFVIIFAMVSVQSYIIFSTNQRQQKLNENLNALFSLNSTVRDKLIELKTLETDMISVVENNLVVPEEDYVNPRSAGPIIRRLSEWYVNFVASPEYAAMEDSRKQRINDMKPYIEQIRASMDKMRKIQNQNERRAILYDDIRPAIASLQLFIDTFSAMGGVLYSMANSNMIKYTQQTNRIQIVIIAAALVLIIFIIIFSQYVLRPIGLLMNGVRNVMEGNLDFRVTVKTRDELGALAGQFNRMTEEIKTHRGHLEELVERRTEQLLEAKNELEKTNENLTETNQHLQEVRRIMDLDMKMAVNVQSNFFLKSVPRSADWDIGFLFKPMSGVSGDMYDIYTDSSDRITGVAMMDVSGHGIASGLVTMIAKTISSRIFSSLYADVRLNLIVDEINNELINNLGTVGNYLTGIMLKFDYEQGQVEYVNAGHTEMLFKRGKTAIVAPSDGRPFKGLFLGLEAMRSSSIMLTFKIRQGDILFLYSDCLIESTNPDGEEFDIGKVISLLDEMPEMTANEIAQYVLKKLVEFTGNDSFNDDLTLIAIKKL